MYTKVTELQGIYSALLDLGIYQTLKEILKMKGIDAGVCREPMKRFDQSHRNELEQLVSRFSL